MKRFVSVAVLLWLFGLPAHAGESDNFFGAFGELIRQAQEQQQRIKQEEVALKRIQSALTRLGYYHGPIDGEYGYKTSEALAAHFRSLGLAVPEQINMVDI